MSKDANALPRMLLRSACPFAVCKLLERVSNGVTITMCSAGMGGMVAMYHCIGVMGGREEAGAE
eukprot:954631-Pleurochrysis_carterae.AAC.1